MDKLNFLEKPDFPLSSTWLDKQYQITRQLADSIAGMVMSNPANAGERAVIYSGCEVNDTQISSGYIVFDGVLYQFRSGEVAQYLVLKRKPQTVIIGVEEYTPYEEYWLEMSSSSTGSEVISAIAWSEVLRYATEIPWTPIPVYGGTAHCKMDMAGNVHLRLENAFTYIGADGPRGPFPVEFAPNTPFHRRVWNGYDKTIISISIYKLGGDAYLELYSDVDDGRITDYVVYSKN
ncbi:MAG: hypothetical protein ACRC9X_05255 [Bacteroidales bacterium]